MPMSDAAKMSRLRLGAARRGARAIGDGGVHPHHEGAALEDVSERNKAEQTYSIADLGGYGDEAGTTGRGSVGAAHLLRRGWL